MGNNDNAVFEAMLVGRDELFDRVMRVLNQHQAGFLGMARGLVWDPARDAFRYVLDQDLEDLDSAREAFLVSAAWPHVIMDFALPGGFEFELHLFHGQPPHEGTESASI